MMTRQLLLSFVLSVVSMALSAQSFTFKAPVDYDYDNMRQVRVDSTSYQIGQLRQGRFVAEKGQDALPLDYGQETRFTAFLVAGGDHAVLTPTHPDMHQRETALFSLHGKVLLAQNIIRDEATSRLDTTYMMNFKVRRLMTQECLPADYDGPFELEIDIAPEDTTAASTLEMVNVTGDTLSIRMDHKTRTLSLKQGETLVEMPLDDVADEDLPGLWHFDVLVSRRSAEVFVNEGRGVLSHTISLQQPLSTVRLMSEQGKTKFSNIAVHRKPQHPLRLKR